MNALVLAESSNTVGNQEDTVKEYYQGQFVKVKKLSQRLSEYLDVDLYVISDDFGLVKGSDIIADIPEQAREQAISDASKLLKNHVGEYDVVVMLLTTDAFTKIVVSNWEEIVATTNPSSIWCIGVAESVLKECDLETLRAKVAELLIYERVGVAPIDNETRDELLKIVGTG